MNLHRNLKAKKEQLKMRYVYWKIKKYYYKLCYLPNNLHNQIENWQNQKGKPLVNKEDIIIHLLQCQRVQVGNNLMFDWLLL